MNGGCSIQSCLHATRRASAVVKETEEDEAVNKIVEKAAVDAAARTAQGDVSPRAEAQEGQQQVAATPGVAAKKGEEPITTEAAIVAPPSAGGRVGDRLVDPKSERPKKTKRSSPVEVSSRVVKTSR